MRAIMAMVLAAGLDQSTCELKSRLEARLDQSTLVMKSRLKQQMEHGQKFVEFVPEAMLIMSIIKEATPCLGTGLEESLINGSRREIEQHENHFCKLAKCHNACGDGLVNLEVAFVEVQKRFQEHRDTDKHYVLDL